MNSGPQCWFGGRRTLLPAAEIRGLACHRQFFLVLAVFAFAVASVRCAKADIIVPATADIDLAGMPNGSSSPEYDSAPQNSPVQVTGLSLVAGSGLNFSASGSGTADTVLLPYVGPNGYDYPNAALGISAPANGIANDSNTVGALVGVFLDSTQPNLSPAPAGLDFANVPGGLFYSVLQPGLKQVFFIGSGNNAGSALSGIPQEIIVPDGATRLYLGYDDFNGNNWNNGGAFDVIVTPAATPEPAPLTMLGAGLLAVAGLGLCRSRGTASGSNG